MLTHLVEEKYAAFAEDDVGDEEDREELEKRRAADSEDLSVPAPPRDSTDIAADGGEADNREGDIADSRDAAPAPPRGEHFDPGGEVREHSTSCLRQNSDYISPSLWM